MGNCITVDTKNNDTLKKKELDDLDTNVNSKTEELQQIIKPKTEKLSIIVNLKKEELAELSIIVNLKKEELAELNTTVNLKKEELAELNTTVNLKKEELDELNSTVNLKKEELDELNTTVNLKKEELDELNTTVNLKKEELAELNTNDNLMKEKLELNNLVKVNSNIKKFTLDGMSMWGKVVHLYDGDTVHIVFIINNNYSKFICRIAHIDTPEMAPKNITDMNERNKEKEAAIRARNYLFEQVTDMKIKSDVSKKDLDILCEQSQKLIWVKCFEFDKYGRLLVELYHNDKSTKSINMDMIDNNFALPYEGKTKETFDSNNFS